MAFLQISSSVRLCLELEEPQGPMYIKEASTRLRQTDPFYGRACRWAMLGEIKT
jgi:hypothetical protein